jgi:hypothetical protein
MNMTGWTVGNRGEHGGTPPRPVCLLGALELAAHYRQRLEPYCERIESTGALRRRRFPWWLREEVRVEFLLIPRVEVGRGGPGGIGEYRQDCLEAAVLELEAEKEFVLVGQAGLWRTRGRYRLINETCELLLWTAEAHNFGSLWLWRTGSPRHTEWLCDRARRRRACWVPHTGLCTGLRVCGAAEEEIYRGLGLRWVPPESREAGQYEAGQYDLPEEVSA